MINTTGAKVMDFYLEEIVLQIAHLNISLLRPLIVLILTPMFKLDPFHFVVTTFSMNIGFCILVAILYPQTNNIFLILNKFLLIFILVGISIVLCFRVRQTDRFLRFNFLYAKIVEEKTKASNLQKEFILKENTSLKKLLEETNLKNSFLKKNSSKEPLLDFDTPISKVILDLKNIQQTTSLSFSLKQNLDEIIQLLSKKSYNLFAPDIHEQLKQKREIDLDGDTKSWATTVLANKAYTRDHNRRVSNNIYSSTSGTGSTAMTGAISRTGSRTTSTSTTTTSTFINTGSLGTGTPLTSPTNSNTTHVVVPAIVPNESTSTSTMQYTNSRLHPDVLAPSEETLLAVSGMMRKDGWNVDIHL
jgi:cAMP-specific phosphodiesterase 4